MVRNESRWFWVFISISVAGHGFLIFHFIPNNANSQYADRRSERLIAVNLITENASSLDVHEPERKRAAPEKPVDRKQLKARLPAPIGVQNEVLPMKVLQAEAPRVDTPQVPAFKPGERFASEPDNLARMPPADLTPDQAGRETPMPLVHAETTKGMVEKAQPMGHVNRKPRYPARAERQGWEGTVVIRIRVEADGRASRVELKKSSGYSILDEAALKEIRQWHFQPASQGGMKIASWITQPVEFTFTE